MKQDAGPPKGAPWAQDICPKIWTKLFLKFDSKVEVIELSVEIASYQFKKNHWPQILGHESKGHGGASLGGPAPKTNAW